jgi:trk system potassium uptake protein TrkH
MAAAALVALASLVVEYGLPERPIPLHLLRLLDLTCVLIFAGCQMAKLVVAPDPPAYLHAHRLDFSLLFVLLAGTVVVAGLRETPEYRYLLREGLPSPLWAFYVALLQAYLLFVVVARSHLLHRLLVRLRLRPAQLLVVSFGTLILVGALLLSLPGASRDGRSIGLVDALFTATSAVCVTGLVVRDTGTQFSGPGLTALVGLIQAGGLGILTITASLAVFGGPGLDRRERRAIDLALDIDEAQRTRRVLGRIVLTTLAIEAAGALVLYVAWRDLLADPLHRAAWAAFHAVSAFCNAGFALFENNASLTAYVGDFAVNATIGGLIVLGGLGFSVLTDGAGALSDALRRRPRRALTRHSRWVLATTALLIVLGAMLFHASEREGVLSGLAGAERWIAAAFQSVTLRTAGFNTVDFAALAPWTVALSVAWMLVGGSPGSTAGGMKTTTAAVLAASLAGRLRSEAALARKALRTALVYVSVFAVSTLLLAALAGQLTAEVPFEAASALGTVGLSMGLTAKLGTPEKILLSLVMFVGRVGPFVLAGALLAREEIEEQTPTPAERRIQLG